MACPTGRLAEAGYLHGAEWSTHAAQPPVAPRRAWLSSAAAPPAGVAMRGARVRVAPASASTRPPEGRSQRRWPAGRVGRPARSRAPAASQPAPVALAARWRLPGPPPTRSSPVQLLRARHPPLGRWSRVHPRPARLPPACARLPRQAPRLAPTYGLPRRRRRRRQRRV